MQDVHKSFMTIPGLKQTWEILRGIPFIHWETNLIDELFAFLNTKKTAIPAELHTEFDNFLGLLFRWPSI